MMVESKSYTKNCVHGAPPPCTHNCPLGINIKKVMKKMAAGNFASAYREYSGKAVFPAIVSVLCDEPCMSECPVGLSMKLLEQTLVEDAADTPPLDYNLPGKNKSVAVIGAGLSGLACTYRLATKGYKVTVFEKSGQLGGHLEELMDRDVYITELEKYLSNIKYTFISNKEIKSLDEIDRTEYLAVYIATGLSGDDFGLLDGFNRLTFETEKPGIFLGGRITGSNDIEALGSGAMAAAAIDSWLKIKRIDSDQLFDRKLQYFQPKENNGEKDTNIDLSGLPYDKVAAAQEAGRCQQCDCILCYGSCEFMKAEGLMPKALEVKANNIRGIATRVSNKTIASCALCGHCTAVCDFDVSTELAMRRGKQMLFEDGGFPPAYHDYYIKDMNEAVGPAFMCRTAPGYDSARYVFFPGCQAAAANTGYVSRPYKYMLENDSDTAIMLSCCGVPALFAGDVKMMNSVHEKIRRALQELDNPTVILSCPTCAKTFAEFLPDVDFISIYEYILQTGLPDSAKAISGDFALFDPCASRQFESMQNSVRLIMDAAGQNYSELPENKERALCCGQGGHIYAANPSLSRKFTESAINQSQQPYISYCTNCRDNFIMNGKESVYALDLIFGIEPVKNPVHILQKQENRYDIIDSLVQEIWKEEAPFGKKSDRSLYNMDIPERVKLKMDKLLISERDVSTVVCQCEESGKFITNAETGLRIGNGRVGYITVWVEYVHSDNNIIYVSNVYCHRMEFSIIREAEPN